MALINAVVIGSVPAPRGIAVGGGSLWVTSFAGAIHRLPLGGGSSMIIATPENPSYVCANATHVYWNDRKNGNALGRISRMPFAGGPIEPIADLHSPMGCALVGDRVHFVEAEGAFNVWMASGNSPPKVVASEPKLHAFAVAANTSEVCWTTGDRPNVICRSGSQSPRALIDGVASAAASLAIDDTQAFWVGSESCMLQTVSLKGGTGSALARPGDLALSGDLVLDEKYAYWICGGTVRRVSKLGGDPTVIYRDPTQTLMGIAVDAQHIYVTGATPGVVLELKKQ